MAYLKLTEQSTPGTGASGTLHVYPDTNTSGLVTITDGGRVNPLSGSFNSAVAAQTLGTSDTYVTNSNLLVPSTGLQVGMCIEWYLSLSKTNASTAAPVWTVRLGTAASTSDTSQWTHTGVAQTAVAETGSYWLLCTVRSIGASGVIQGTLECTRTGGTAATGLASVPAAEVTGAGADKTYASGQVIGLSINPGASSSWVVTQCRGRIY